MGNISGGLTGFERRLLKKCAASRSVRRCPDGGLKAGAVAAPAHVADGLMRRGLVETDGDRVVASAAGRALLARLDAAGRPEQTPYAAQHRPVAKRTFDRQAGTAQTVNLAESPLGRLARLKGRQGRPLLSPDQVTAGDRLRSDFERAGLAPRLTRGLDDAPSRTRRGPDRADAMTAAQLDARRRYEAAVAAMGPGLSDVAVRVCCFLEGLETAERTLAWPTRSGKLVLGFALDRLHDHYAGRR